MEWVLIIMLWKDSIAVVNGFESRQECVEAAKIVRREIGGVGFNLAASCIPRKAKNSEE